MNRLSILVAILAIGCQNAENRPAPSPQISPRHDSASLQQPAPLRSIENIRKHTWAPRHADTAAYLCELRFHDEYAVNSFHGQCVYYFFTYPASEGGKEQIELLWTYKSDCVLDMDFLQQAHGLRSYPRNGDRFATYEAENDSMIRVRYDFPEWVAKVNAHAKDSLFPQWLYRQNDH